MKKFVFSMEKILELRKFKQKEAEAELGKVNSQIAQEQRKIEEFAASQAKVTSQLSGNTDFNFISQAQSYFVFLNQKKEECFKKIAQLEIIAEQKRENVKKAMQDVKVLEKLRENKYEEWKKETSKAEEEEIDDAVTSKINMEKNGII